MDLQFNTLAGVPALSATNQYLKDWPQRPCWSNGSATAVGVFDSLPRCTRRPLTMQDASPFKLPVASLSVPPKDEGKITR